MALTSRSATCRSWCRPLNSWRTSTHTCKVPAGRHAPACIADAACAAAAPAARCPSLACFPPAPPVPGRVAEEVLTELRGQHQKYKYIEAEVVQRKRRLVFKEPEIAKCLDAVTLLLAQREAGEEVRLCAVRVPARQRVALPGGQWGDGRRAFGAAGRRQRSPWASGPPVARPHALPAHTPGLPSPAQQTVPGCGLPWRPSAACPPYSPLTPVCADSAGLWAQRPSVCARAAGGRGGGQPVAGGGSDAGVFSGGCQGARKRELNTHKMRHTCRGPARLAAPSFCLLPACWPGLASALPCPALDAPPRPARRMPCPAGVRASQHQPRPALRARRSCWSASWRGASSSWRWCSGSTSM